MERISTVIFVSILLYIIIHPYYDIWKHNKTLTVEETRKKEFKAIHRTYKATCKDQGVAPVDMSLQKMKEYICENAIKCGRA